MHDSYGHSGAKLFPSRINRRGFVQRLAVLGGGVAATSLLAACGNLGSSSTEPSATTPPTAASGSVGATAPAAASPVAGGASPVAQASPQAAAPIDSGAFVGLVRNEPETADPAIGANNATGKLFFAVYEPLVRVKPGGAEIEPFLAEKWDISSDGKTYTFQLRGNVKFHDGSTLDSNAVKLSLERMKKINLGNAWVLSSVSAINTPSAQTVEIVLNQASQPFLQGLPLIYIVSAKAITEHAAGDDLAQAWLKENVVGTGPYALSQWVKGQQYTLNKFNDYWRGWNGRHFSKLTLQTVAEAATQRQLMEAGQGDWADSIGTDDLIAMRRSGKFIVNTDAQTQVAMAMMNTRKAPLDNPKVRQAIRAAIDYTSLSRDIMQGLVEIPKGPLAPSYPEHDPSIPTEQTDVNKAKALLAEAGVTSATLNLVYFNGLAWERPAAELVASNLAPLGITLKLEGLPGATFQARLAAEDPAQRPDIMFYYAGAATSSPDSVFGVLFYTRSSSIYRFGYSNPAIDTLVDQVRTTADSAQRTAIYRQLQKLVDQDSPGANLFLKSSNHVFKGDIDGFKPVIFQADMIDYYELFRKA